MPLRKLSRQKQICESLARIVSEYNMSIFELTGRFLANCQTIETQMKAFLIYTDERILKSIKSKKEPFSYKIFTVEGLDRYTFGKLFNTFIQRCKDKELKKQLNSVKEMRNDVVHSFFIINKNMKDEIGDFVERLNHKMIRKAIRMTEFCIAKLDQLLKTVR